MAGVVRRDGLREMSDQIARTLVEAGCNDPWHVVYRCAYALIESRVLDAVPDVPPDPPAEHEDRLAELHANYHDQPGNLLWSDDCGYERCDFWAVATFPGVLVGAADVRARALEDAADSLPDMSRWGIRKWLRDRAVSEREGTT